MSPDRYLISLMKSASVSMGISKHSNRKMAGVISFLSIVPFLGLRSSLPHHLNHGYHRLPLAASVRCDQREGTHYPKQQSPSSDVRRCPSLSCGENGH